MPTAIIYARVSTVGQAEKELSVPAQIEQGRKKAAALGADVARVFTDDGISASSDKRPAFQDAITYAEIYQPDFLITWNTSRFARNKIDAALYKRRLDKAGVRVVYVSVDLDSKTDAGWLLESVLEVFDEMHSRSTAADTKRSMMKNARSGFWNGGAAPFGYKAVPSAADPKRKALMPEESEAAVLVEIFKRRAAGDGAQAIAMAMNKAGMKNRTREWRRRTILDLLRNESALGRVVFNKKDKRGTGRVRPRQDWVVIDSHQAIISQELWDAVQATMPLEHEGNRDGNGNNTWAFTGLLKCGCCGKRMRITKAKGRSKSYTYYVCSTWYETETCRNIRIRADILEAWLLDAAMDQVFSLENITETVQELNQAAGKWATEMRRRRQVLTGAIDKIEGRNRRLYEILELHGKDAPNLQDLTARLRGNNVELKGLQDQLRDLEAMPPEQQLLDKAQIEEVRAFLVKTVKTTQNYRGLRNFLRSFVRSVSIGSEDVTLEYDPRSLVTPQVQAVHSDGGWCPGGNTKRTAAGLSGEPRVLKLILPPGAVATGHRGGRNGNGRAAA